MVDWRGRLISGVLTEDSKDIEDKKAGSTVEVIDDWVFDYRHILPDGTESGNETAALIRKASQAPGANGNGKGGPSK